MFERQIYKKQARTQLTHHWKTPFLIGLITWAVSQSISLAATFISFPNFLQFQSYLRLGSSTTAFDLFDLLLFSLTGVVGMASAYFYLAFVKDNNSTFTTFLEGFALWSKGLRDTLWTILWVLLWALLFIIPGIVKLIAYSQTYFIMADSPKVGVCKAMKLSIAMTKGYKGELFVMGLSFFGWILLLAIFPIIVSIITEIFLPMGIVRTSIESLSYVSLVAIYPYINTSAIYAYQYMKQDAINRKILTNADFGQDESLQTIEQPTTQQATVEKPAAEHAPAEKPTTQQTTVEKPVAEQSTAEKPIV